MTLPPPAGAVNVGTASGKPPQADRPAPQTKRYSSQRQRNVADIDGGNHTPPPATGKSLIPWTSVGFRGCNLEVVG